MGGGAGAKLCSSTIACVHTSLRTGDKSYCKCEKMCQNCTHIKGKQYILAQLMVLLTWQQHNNHKTTTFSYLEHVFAPLIMVELTLFHHCNAATNKVPPLGEGKLTPGTKILLPKYFMLAALLQRCNMVSSTSLNQQAITQILGWHKGKRKRFNTRWLPN